MSLNEYNKISSLYNKSHTKPDKLFSILPTIISIVRDFKNPKTITDLGCGDGFFTFPLAYTFPNTIVTGLDNSSEQIKAAHTNTKSSLAHNVIFLEKDIFIDELPQSDIIITPFVFGYCPKDSLESFLKKIQNALNENGLLVIVLDDPKGINNAKFGAHKEVHGNMLQIHLYGKDGDKLPTLHAFYHEPKHFVEKLKEIGFKNIKTHTPLISEDGIEQYGADWWGDYKNTSELCYISCTK